VAGAIFVVAGSSGGQQGPVAALVSTAGWASAAQRVLGQAWICTPSGVVAPEEARRQGSDPSLRSADVAPLRRRLPAPLKTAIKDVRSWRRASRFTIGRDGPWAPEGNVRFVWQRHELFQDAGLRLARSLGVPSVLFVPATVVWEADRWGSSRPGWGRWLERVGERPSLRAADLVACGSDEVAEQVHRLGVPEHRVLQTPSGADIELFGQSQDRERVRRDLELDDGLVVGWVGSFRGFHALDLLVDAAAGLAGVSLLLVGDGPERPRIEQHATDRGVRVVCTGTVPHEELPSYLAAMDAAVVLAGDAGSFHYSPLKLAEYLAAGLAVVAPRVGQVQQRLRDGGEALLVRPGDVDEITRALVQLRDDPALRRRLGEAARAAAVTGWSWDRSLRLVLQRLDRVGSTAARGDE
jgi:glycosyltransferase involved in cell wall biosynthesis